MSVNAMFEEVASVLNPIPIDFGGGCSLHKASVMAWLIKTFGLKTTLDIGVYRGRSLFPQAVSHKHGAGGLVYGVDPWSAFEASEDDNPDLKEKIDEFVRTTDFDELFRSVDDLNKELRLTSHCVLVRKKSSQASPWFDEQKINFDLIHVDGNHDTERVMEDLDLYMPKLNPGGFIVLDDVSWDSVKPAYDRLNNRMKLLYKKVDEDKMNDFAVFWDQKFTVNVLVNRFRMKLSIPE